MAHTQVETSWTEVITALAVMSIMLWLFLQ
jgi:hypothetical protein